MIKGCVLALAIIGTTLTTAAAQDKPLPAPPSAQPAASSGARQVPLRVQLVLSRFQGEKKISSVPYMLGVLTNSQKTSLRMGIQVPVIMTVFGAKDAGGFANIPQSSYSYRDVGTNIDCAAQDAGNGLFNLAITVADSSIYLDRAPAAPDQKPMLADVAREVARATASLLWEL
jgi:hypothetical protein